jgi:hypothetical protein
MQRILGARIVKWYFKLAYVAGVWLVGCLLQRLLELVDVPAAAVSLVGSVLSLSGILLGARVFRGRNELLVTPRPWWRMTARRPLSVVLGTLAVLGAASSVVVLVAGAVGNARFARSLESITVPGALVNLLWYAVLAYLYLNSAVRSGEPTLVGPAPVVPGPRSTTAIVQEVARVLSEHGLPDTSGDIVRALLTRGWVGRSDIAADVPEATGEQLLRELNAVVEARR